VSGAIVFQLYTKIDLSFEQRPNWTCPTIQLKEPNKFSRLYIFDAISGCWYGDPKSVECKIPSPKGTYAIVSKERVTSGFEVYRDLLMDGDYLQPVRGDPSLDKCNPNGWSGYRVGLKVDIPDDYVKCYHGTTITAIESIIRDGLLIPGTISSNGKEINPTTGHIARNTNCFGIQDFSRAIFVTPSFGYASHHVYARQFHWNGKRYKPVLECFVAKDGCERYKSTTPSYEATKQDPELLEWRVTDPLKLLIGAVLMIQIKM